MALVEERRALGRGIGSRYGDGHDRPVVAPNRPIGLPRKRGLRVRCKFPAGRRVSTLPQQSKKGTAVQPPFPRRPRRVLVADDDDGYADALTTVLGLNPDLVVVGRARDGAEAVVLAHALRPDAIVMDVNMPFLDGFEATRRIVAELPRVRVVVVSGTPETRHPEHAVESGAFCYLPKDVFAGELADALLKGPARTERSTLRLALAS
jgi:CheY-like chemotaxis protein